LFKSFLSLFLNTLRKFHNTALRNNMNQSRTDFVCLLVRAASSVDCEKAQNSRVRSGFIAGIILQRDLDFATRGLRYLRRLLVASMISRLVDSALRSCSSLKILEAPWRCTVLLVSDALTRRLLTTSWTRLDSTQIRVNRCCALQDYFFRHTTTSPLLCPGWSHCGSTQFALTVQGCSLALHFASSPSVNERSTLVSPFCLLPVTSPRGSICLA